MPVADWARCPTYSKVRDAPETHLFDTFDTQALVPEDRRAQAIETKDGKWVVAKKPEPLGDGGKAALDAERDARKAAEKLAKDTQKALDDLKLEKEGRDKGVADETVEKWKKERDDAVAKVEAEKLELRKQLDRNETERQFRAIASLPDVKVFMERLDADNTAIMTRNLGVVDGKLTVLGADGKPTTDDPKAHILAMKASRPYLFRGDGADGLGGEASGDIVAGDGAAAAIAAGKQMAKEQKVTSEGNKLAFQ